MALCGQAVRGGGTCTLAHGHRGYHSTVTFVCEGCGVPRRQPPAVHGAEYDGTPLNFCFICYKEAERFADEAERLHEQEHLR